MRAMEAASRRANREAERQWKAEQKAMMIADASDAVAEWCEHLRDIVSLHVDPTDDVDWQSLRDQREPVEPKRLSLNEEEAAAALDSFKPKFFDFLVGGSEKRRMKLVSAVEDAKISDEIESRNRIKRYEQEHLDWQIDRELATRLLAGDASAERDVISEMSSWNDDGLVGTRLEFSISDQFLHAVAYVHSDDVVPTYRRKQLQSGKLSETKMPIGERNELYQDYVCSVALKVAGDLFSVLPRNEVFVTCTASMLDSVTGHMADTPILSVQFVRPTFTSLNLSGIDPSDSMANFNHNMSFKRTKAFSPVQALQKMPS
ncbi:hypothetical protein [Erythrobacter crassostreae]|uniref:Uncharacterized protein n=1 Tax=Erythrobacter crassostreae TaxID=2828328 RepID=A0A9X1F0G3_9SPHN|nr:hypothetical protein [Erythrobacter crassostrea]MBV7258045.1 hypothetical protein [Erythrobacter crassostrea]